MNDLAARLQHYAAQSAALEPDRAERALLLERVNAYVENFLSEVPTRPAFIDTDHQGRALYDSPIAEQGMGVDEVLRLFKDNVDDVGLSPVSGRFLAYIPPCSMYHGALGEFLAGVTDKFAGDFSNCPGAVRLEHQLLRWMGGLIGYRDAMQGYLTSGGSMGNLTAIVTAREARGLKAAQYPQAVVYVTDHTHHSIDKSLRIAGLAECTVRRVPMDAGFRMDPARLEDCIARDRAAGLLPWLLVGSSGTTDLGAVDDLAALGDIAHRNGLWYHVDGAYGALFILSDVVREKFRGIEQSDSIVMNPHKALYTPFGLAAVLVKKGEYLYQTHFHTANYLQDTFYGKEEVSPADLGPELTRPFRGLRLWLPLKILGVAPFRAALSEKILLARYAYEKLRGLPGFEVGPYPDLSIFAFRYLPQRGEPDEFNKRLVEELRRDGTIFLSSTVIGGNYMIRFAVLSFRTHQAEIDQAIDLIRRSAGALVET
jgi:glutamate/tyrosine decarboxylase-like PLP-dependent enzyme